MKVYLADDHKPSFDFLVGIIREKDGWELVGSASSLCHFMKDVFTKEPDVVLISTAFLALLSPDDKHQLSGTLPASVIVAISDSYGPGEIRLALRLGARDLISSDLGQDEVIDLLQSHYDTTKRCSDFLIKQHGFSQVSSNLPALSYETSKTVKLALFTSAKGGVGKTFIACHVAGILAAFSDARILLIDLAGFSGPSMVLKPYDEDLPDTAELIPVIDELNDQHIEHVSVRREPGFFVMKATIDATEDNALHPEHINKIVSLAKESYDVILIDISEANNLVNKDLRELVDQIYIVTTLNLSSFVSNENKLRRHKIENSSEHAVSLIVNRFDSRLSIKDKDIQEITGLPVSAKICEDLGLAACFEREGKVQKPRIDLSLIQSMMPIAQYLYPFEIVKDRHWLPQFLKRER